MFLSSLNTLFHYIRRIGAIAVFAMCTTSFAAPPSDRLDVRLSVSSPVLRGNVDVFVNVTITNTSRQPAAVWRWQLPADELQGKLFRIKRDGQPVSYTGPIIHRAPSVPEDRVRLDPGASLSYDVELTAAYDLSRDGRYTIEYSSRGSRAANTAALQSEPLNLWLEGRTVSSAAGKPGGGGGGNGITFTNCSATQQTELQSVVAESRKYSAAAVQYLKGVNSGSDRYLTWFGAYTTARKDTVFNNFSRIDGRLSDSAQLDCKCKSKAYVAYVYADEPYKIYLCGWFWTRTQTGTNSKAGTLIHEMSHFNLVAGTDDIADGHADAQALAVSSPDEAIDNADSYQFFAENEPFRP